MIYLITSLRLMNIHVCILELDVVHVMVSDMWCVHGNM